jgi:hypothetical protein
MENKPEQKEQPKQTKKTTYLFPNGGDVMPHSVDAESLEEATKLNDEHIKQSKGSK